MSAVVAAGIASAATSGATPVATATNLVDPAAYAFDGPLSAVTSYVNHAICSSYDAGMVCTTVTSARYVPEKCRPWSCVPTRSTSRWRAVWAEPDVLRVELSDTSAKPFIVNAEGRSSLGYVASASNEPPGGTSTQTNGPIGVFSARSAGCGDRVSGWVTVPARGRVSICFLFQVPTWQNGPLGPESGPVVTVSRPLWSALNIGNVAMWENQRIKSTPSYGAGPDIIPSVGMSVSLSAADAYITSTLSYPSGQDPAYGFEQVFGTATGQIWLRAGSSGSPRPYGLVPRPGVVLLMVRQRSHSGRTYPTVITDAYLNVASACTRTGCTITRYTSDGAFPVSRLTACSSRNSFDCVAFDLPGGARIIGGAYNVTLWGPYSHGSIVGNVFGAGSCQGNDTPNGSVTECVGGFPW